MAALRHGRLPALPAAECVGGVPEPVLFCFSAWLRAPLPGSDARAPAVVLVGRSSPSSL